MARPTLYTHRKFARLCHDLKMPEPHVLGHLEYLWSKGYTSGDDLLGDSLDVELAAKWTGEPGVLCAALLAVRFIDQVGDVYHIHHLLENAPEYVKARRSKEQERKNRKTCEACGETYTSTRNDSKTCSERCRTALHRSKNKIGDVTDNVTDINVTETFRHTTPAPAPAPAHNKRGAGAIENISDPEADGRELLTVGEEPPLRNSNPRNNNRGQKNKRREGIAPPGFLRFWQEWPPSIHKKARKQCLDAWDSDGLEALAEIIVSAVKAFKASECWQSHGGKYIPAPKKWIAEQSWEVSEASLRSDSPIEQIGTDPEIWEKNKALILQLEQGISAKEKAVA